MATNFSQMYQVVPVKALQVFRVALLLYRTSVLNTLRPTVHRLQSLHHRPAPP